MLSHTKCCPEDMRSLLSFRGEKKTPKCANMHEPVRQRRYFSSCSANLYFLIVYNYGNYSNVLENHWENNSANLHQWQCFKDLVSKVKISSWSFTF